MADTISRPRKQDLWSQRTQLRSLDVLHASLVKLAGIGTSSQVLDAGCGTGLTLKHITAAGGKVVGIDNNIRFLDRARLSFTDALASGQVELHRADLNQHPLPFEEATFDVVICQNVIECLFDKHSFINDFRRILKPDGIFLLSHHDFGGIMINSACPDTARKIVAAYADEVQPWMATADGEIGRKLPGLMQTPVFREKVTETQHLVDLRFSEGGYAFEYCQNAAKAAIRAGLSETDIKAWFDSLIEIDGRGEFYFGLPWVYVRAVK